MQNTDLIGQKVISTNFGLGTIVNIEPVGSEDNLFYIIESDQNVKSFIPFKDFTSFRLISKPDIFTQKIKELSSKSFNQDFPSKKDRINYFKGAFKNQTLDSLCSYLFHLNSFEDKGSVEVQIFNKLIDNLALEHSIVSQVNLEKSQDFIKEFLQ